MADCESTIRVRAMGFLKQREHGRQELEMKLGRALPQCQASIVDVLDQLETDGWLSEVRFVDAFIRKEVALGHGPFRVTQALLKKGVCADLISEMMQASDVNWAYLAQKVRIKKFGDQLPTDRLEKMMQMRFLSYRGFDGHQIQQVFKSMDE